MQLIYYSKTFCNYNWSSIIYDRGFNLMYPGFEEGSAGFFKFAGFGIGAPEGGMTPGYADGGYTWWTDFLFQGMFSHCSYNCFRSSSRENKT